MKVKCPNCNSSSIRQICNGNFSFRCLYCGIKFDMNTPKEIYEKHKGAPITYDDILDFHQQLQKLEAKC